MNKAEFKARILECGERSFYADDTVNNIFKRNPIYIMSWGWDKLIYLESKDYPDEQVGFMFNVTGLLYKGAVMVTLSWKRNVLHIQTKNNDVWSLKLIKLTIAGVAFFLGHPVYI